MPCLLQRETGFLTALKEKCVSSPNSVTADDINMGMLCLDLASHEGSQAATTASFCEIMCDWATHGGSPACDRIPIGACTITRFLQRFADHKDVTYWTCKVLCVLADNGSKAFKANIRTAERDHTGRLLLKVLLEAASLRLQSWGSTDYAAAALEKLGL